MNVKPRVGKKVLVASVGVATMTYVAACGSTVITGEDGGADAAAEGSPDSGAETPVGNLALPDAHSTDSPSEHATTDTIDEFPVANLVANPDH